MFLSRLRFTTTAAPTTISAVGAVARSAATTPLFAAVAVTVARVAVLAPRWGKGGLGCCSVYL